MKPSGGASRLEGIVKMPMNTVGTMAPRCFCGSTTSLRSNKLLYNGREFGNGKAWICDRFPECRGSVGTHPDGRQLGTVPDMKTKAMRIRLHGLIDPIWRREKDRKTRQNVRHSVYGWLSRITGKPALECHVGMFSFAECEATIEAIKTNPYEKREAVHV